MRPSRNGRKAFSREFPDTASNPDTFSRSFHSPSSRAAELGSLRMTERKSLTRKQLSLVEVRVGGDETSLWFSQP